MQVLGGDVGGTKVGLALYEWRGGRLVGTRAAAFASREHDSLGGIVRAFLGEPPPRLDAAAFGVAGPVRDGRAPITNLPWVVDAAELRVLLGIDRVTVINDLEATAYGVLTLDERDLLTLNRGNVVQGTAAIIAAGTGLGEGLLFWDGQQHHPAPSEGGHVEFAPCDERQSQLLAFLRRRSEHVSYERLLSGPGLVNIYEFLRDTGQAEEPAALAARLQHEDPAAVISHAGLEDGTPICVQALDIFAAVYGAEAGNLALKVLATGGVYVAGGIAPKIQAKLVDGTFMAAFRAKGRMATLLEAIPVRVVLREDTALRGAGYCAVRSARVGVGG